MKVYPENKKYNKELYNFFNNYYNKIEVLEN